MTFLCINMINFDYIHPLFFISCLLMPSIFLYVLYGYYICITIIYNLVNLETVTICFCFTQNKGITVNGKVREDERNDDPAFLWSYSVSLESCYLEKCFLQVSGPVILYA